MGKQVHQQITKMFKAVPFVEEAAGTFFLIFWTVLLCWLMEITDFPVPWTDLGKSDLGDWFLLAFVFGLTYIPVLWLLCFFFRKSSAHFNPAVTISCWANRAIGFRRAFYNIFAQFIGCVIAGALMYVIAGLATPSRFGSQWSDPTTLGITSVKAPIYANIGDPLYIGSNPDFNNSNEIICGPLSQFVGFLVEFVGFAIFMFLILNSGWLSNKAAKKATPKNQQYLGTLFVSIGLCFFVFVEIPETGASLNPFRSLAPVIFQSWGSQGEVGWAYMWIYFAAPILGGLLAAIINRRIHKINLYPVC